MADSSMMMVKKLYLFIKTLGYNGNAKLRFFHIFYGCEAGILLKQHRVNIDKRAKCRFFRDKL